VPARDVPDAGQEVFRAVAGAVGGFRRERQGESFCGWLRTITRNKVRDYFRRRPAEGAAAGGSDARDLLLGVEDREEDSELELAEEKRLLYQRAVGLIRAEFEEQTWEAFRRVVIEGQEPAEVAGLMGLTPNAVYCAKSRVLHRLREEFAGLLDS
jgi:RNA polymerase sigma-70 factor (ECF subfamily)